MTPQGQPPTLTGTKFLLVATGHPGPAGEANAPLSLSVFDVWFGVTARLQGQLIGLYSCGHQRTIDDKAQPGGPLELCPPPSLPGAITKLQR